ncbi:MAG TPA: DUF6384 family protein [Candidatus Tectomicrobia bacterium]|nr:DUF6384 family protein [Candidatus Tectomicrobia bacterium]
MADAPATGKAPLDEVMLAMDVVDTLRHRTLLVERELNAEDRDQKLLERLRELYAAQGIEVPDHVLQAGVRALHEDRFTYKPPAPGIKVTLARLYIARGKWIKGLLAIVALVVVLWGGYALFISGPRARHLAALPGVIEAQRQAIVQEAVSPVVKARAEQLATAGRAALREGNTAAAERAIGDLQTLRAQLEQTYELRIVSRPDELSGVWRLPDRNPQARNYYIIVEAVTPDGKVLELPVLNEEDGKTSMVNKWGLRVDEPLFRQIAADKQDDGIIQNRRFGIKRRGQLAPEYLMPTTGAAITSW